MAGPQGNLSQSQADRLLGELMRAPVYRAGTFPAWLRKRLKAIPENSLGIEFYSRGHWSMSGGRSWPGWLDHFGYYVAPDGTEVFVTEPYDLIGDKIEGALAFAREVGAELHVSPVSTWYPTHTVRLEFWPETPNTHRVESEGRAG